MNENKNILNILFGYLFLSLLLLISLTSIAKIAFIVYFLDDFYDSYNYNYHDFYMNLLQAFGKNYRFDMILISYIMIPQFVLLVVYMLWNSFKTKIYFRISKILFIVPTSLILLLYILDIPYYDYFWKHFSPVVLKWLVFKNTYSMLFQENSYIIFGIIALVFLVVYIIGINWIAKRSVRITYFEKVPRGIRFGIFALSCVLLFFGTKGHFHLTRIPTKVTLFTVNSMMQQFSLGTPYSFYNSLINGSGTSLEYDKLMSDDEALRLVQKQLNLDSIKGSYQNPLTRQITSIHEKTYPNANVIFIFMESLSYNFLDSKNTPFIDSIRQHCIFFDSFYSEGSRTNQGIGAALTGTGSRVGESILQGNATKFNGIINILGEKNYYTSFFITHEKSFDNIGRFAEKNNINRLYSLSDYDPAANTGSFGVQDKYLYNFSLLELDKMQQPFFASILTIDNHSPLIVPEEYKKLYDNDQVAVLRSVDDNLRTFLTRASTTDWYDNTIFVIFGDHGRVVDRVNADIQPSVNHIPLIIYSPLFEEDIPQVVNTIATQIDLGETILGLLGIPHINNTYATDIFSPQRCEYISFTDSENAICMSDSMIHVYNPYTKKRSLYKTKDNNWENVLDQYPEEADEMHKFALSRIVTTNFVLENNLTDKY